MVLENEQAYFIAHREELVQHHEGMFVLIKDETLVGAFDTEQAAYEEGIRRFGNQAMLIRRVAKDDDPVGYFPALTLGLINAHLL